MRSADKIIEDAMKSGAFDDLAGKGQPLPLEHNPNADPEWELAYHLLKENGFAPAFIEERQVIEKELAAARGALARAWAGRAAEGGTARWAQACRQFEEQAAVLNKKIRDYNLTIPHDKLARAAIDPAKEIEQTSQGG
ncbi:MAG: DUF1992 domain-containing protein [Anaerolineales bacterium]|nr:DUF1992 domain-containing protein [Anaerolineales bacterium]